MAADTSLADELKPCPFCGCEASERCEESDGPYWIECDMCGVRNAACRWSDNAVGAWNTRAALTPVPDAVGLIEWNEEVAFILGRPGFMFIQEAQLFRSLGYDIPTKAEAEQAFFIHRWLNFYLQQGDAWRDAANADIREHIERAKTADAPDSLLGTTNGGGDND